MSVMFAALFVPLGIHLPYFPLWLDSEGFDAGQIAIILSAPMFLRVVTTPFITAMADEAKDRATVLTLLSAAALLLSAGYFLRPTYLIVLAVSLVLAVAWTPLTPLIDSVALSGVRRFGANYPRMRIWGSVSFLAANLGGGFLLSATGAGAVPAIIAVTLAGTVAATFLVPRMGRPRRASSLSVMELQEEGPRLLNRTFLLFVTGTGLIVSSHGFMYGFASIYWKSIGIEDSVIGLLWSFAVVAEVGMFVVFNRLFSGFSAPVVVVMAGVAAVIRWVAYPYVWPLGFGVSGFLAVQAAHAFSTGLILIGVQKLIAETVAEERTGAAQGIAFFANGFATAAVTLASGPLYASFGIEGMLAMAAVSALGVALVLMAIRSTP